MHPGLLPMWALTISAALPCAGCISHPVGGAPSCTLYETVARMQLPGAQVGKWDSPRYSLLRLEPLTGR